MFSKSNLNIWDPPWVIVCSISLTFTDESSVLKSIFWVLSDSYFWIFVFKLLSFLVHTSECSCSYFWVFLFILLSFLIHISVFSDSYFWVFLFKLLSFLIHTSEFFLILTSEFFIHTSDTLMLFLGGDVWYPRWQGEQRRQQRKTGTDQWSLRQVNKMVKE